MDDLTENALVPLPSGGEIALPDQLVEAAQEYMAKSKAESTRVAYDYWQTVFVSWCKRHRCQSLPASEETVAAWITDLARNGSGDRRTKTGKIIPSRPLSRSSINQALAALQALHIDEGYSLSRKHRVLGRVLAGIRRDKVEVARRAAPVMIDDLADLLDVINTEKNVGCRNAALLTLMFGAALRRSEAVGLDLDKLGSGTGYLTMDARGILIVLMRSKASQESAVEIAIPIADRPEACAALQAWIERADIKPGEPIFRGVLAHNVIGPKRLRGESVSRIVKKTMKDLARARGMSKTEAKQFAARYSGHSPRAGLVSSAAVANVPALKIAQLSRHRSLEMVLVYCRQVEQFTDSPHKVIRARRGPAPKPSV